MRAYLARLKAQWVNEGTKAKALTDTLADNTAAASRNTEAVNGLTREIRDLAVKTEERFQAQERRLDRIEARGWSTGPDR